MLIKLIKNLMINVSQRWAYGFNYKVISMYYLLFGSSIVFVSFILLMMIHTNLLEEKFITPLPTNNIGLYSTLVHTYIIFAMFFFSLPSFVWGISIYLIPKLVGSEKVNGLLFPKLTTTGFWLLLSSFLPLLVSFIINSTKFITSFNFGRVWCFPISEIMADLDVAGIFLFLSVCLSCFSHLFNLLNIVLTIRARYLKDNKSAERLYLFLWTVAVAATFLFLLLLLGFFSLNLFTLEYIYDYYHRLFHHNACSSIVLFWNLFWFFEHPEIYIILLPFLGVISHIIQDTTRSREFFGESFIRIVVLVFGLLLFQLFIIRVFYQTLWINYSLSWYCVFLIGVVIFLISAHVITWLFTWWQSPGPSIRSVPKTLSFVFIGYYLINLVGTSFLLYVRINTNFNISVYTLIMHFNCILVLSLVFILFIIIFQRFIWIGSFAPTLTYIFIGLLISSISLSTVIVYSSSLGLPINFVCYLLFWCLSIFSVIIFIATIFWADCRYAQAILDEQQGEGWSLFDKYINNSGYRFVLWSDRFRVIRDLRRRGLYWQDKSKIIYIAELNDQYIDHRVATRKLEKLIKWKKLSLWQKFRVLMKDWFSLY
jgi:cytochrome c oxidase subunit 1